MRALHMIDSLGRLERIPNPGDYTHVVVNPGFTKQDLDTIRRAMPAAQLYATINAHSIPEYGKGNRALDYLRELMGDHTVLADGWERFRVSDTWEHKLLDFSMEAAEDYANWIQDTLDEIAGFDGVYIDELWGDDLPPEMIRRFTWKQDYLKPRWPGYRDTLLRLLAEYPGPVLCNTAGYIPMGTGHRGLASGMCIEAGHMAQIVRLSRYRAAAIAGMTLNIDWYGGLDVDGVVMPGDRAPA